MHTNTCIYEANITMGPGPGLVARDLWLVAVLHAASVIRCGGCASGSVRCITLAAPYAHTQ